MIVPPSDDLASLVEKYSYDDPEDCELALKHLDYHLSNYVFASSQDAWRVITVAEEWAGLMSYPVICTYWPRSRPRFVTWSASVPERLWQMVGRFRHDLDRAAQRLGAVSVDIGVGFPNGVTVGLSWAARAGGAAIDAVIDEDEYWRVWEGDQS